jgi:O-antigen/teichoic acid export membrane protein
LKIRLTSIRVNALSQWLSYGVNALIMLGLTPFIIHKLDATGFGIWRFAVTFAGYYGFLNIAVSSSVTRYVARDAGRGDTKSLNETISTAMAIYLFSAIIAIGISLIFADDIVRFFDKTPPALAGDFRKVIWILGFSTGLGFIMGLLGGIVSAHEHYVAISLTGIGINLLRAGLTLGFLAKGMGLVGVAWANLIPTAIGIPVNYAICRWLIPNARITIVHARWETLRKLLVYGATTVVIVLADMLRTQIDSTVIGKVKGFDEVAVYSIPCSLLGQIASFAVAGIGVLTPRFASLEGEGRMEELRSLFLKSLHFSAVMGVGLCLLAFFWGGNFVYLWVGPGFDRAIPVLWIIAAAWVTDLSQIPSIGIL